jgi:hypothetical protein
MLVLGMLVLLTATSALAEGKTAAPFRNEAAKNSLGGRKGWPNIWVERGGGHHGKSAFLRRYEAQLRRGLRDDDRDGIQNRVDVDDDNDGTLDEFEPEARDY